MPPSIRQAAASAAPKVTNVYASTGDALNDILGAGVADEPEPTPEAVARVEAIQRGEISGASVGGVSLVQPGGPAGDGGAGALLGGADPVTARQAAADTVAMLIGVGRFIGAEEWEPDSSDERNNLEASFARVYEKRGAPPTPPELMLLLTVGRYAQKRMTRPKTAARVGSWLARLPMPGFVRGALGLAAAEPEQLPAVRDLLPGDRPPEV